MARLTERDFSTLRAVSARNASRPLGEVRTAQDARSGADVAAWLSAGDTLAEKAIAALDTGEHDRADRLVERLIALPAVDGGTPTGLLAVELLLRNEVLEPLDGSRRGFLDLPLRLLPSLEPDVADELRRVLASLAADGLPGPVVRRIHEAAPPGAAAEEPFAGVGGERLPAAVEGVLRLVLRLRLEAD